MKILYFIEDEPDLLEMAQETLEDEGFDCHAFATAEAALEKITSIVPDLILSDLNLGSGLNGLEMTEKLRGLGGGFREIPIFILSGDGESVDAKKEELAINGRIDKPFNIFDVVDQVKNFFEN